MLGQQSFSNDETSPLEKESHTLQTSEGLFTYLKKVPIAVEPTNLLGSYSCNLSLLCQRTVKSRKMFIKNSKT